jgi:hypothetical protein
MKKFSGYLLKKEKEKELVQGGKNATQTETLLYFVGQEEANGLHGLLSAVHVVAKEEVVGLWGKPAIPSEKHDTCHIHVLIERLEQKSFRFI